ncbi:unnamed protein product [Urochloa humidicola]
MVLIQMVSQGKTCLEINPYRLQIEVVNEKMKMVVVKKGMQTKKKGKSKCTTCIDNYKMS